MTVSLLLTMAMSGCPWQDQVSWWCLDILDAGILFPAGTLLTFILVFEHSYCKVMLPVKDSLSEVSVDRFSWA